MSSKRAKWFAAALGLALAAGAVAFGAFLLAGEQTEAVAEPVPLDQFDGPRINTEAEKVAIKGYDPVAYFVEGRPVKGLPQFAYVWQDARWYFASSENRDLFVGHPEEYSPQYGGFCALGVAYGFGADVDPEAWSIVDGRLFLNHDLTSRDEFRQDLAGNIAQADNAWSRLAAN